jgi:beta-lactamase regulating signal transducer with metallopeptidase domain/protocatechuate 3,4-dioxygenase beta subunit
MHALLEALNRAAATWWPFVLHVTWQASLLAALLLALVWAGRRWPSPLRYWLLVLALVKFALPPLVSLPTGLFSQVGPTVRAVAPEPVVHTALVPEPVLVETPAPSSFPFDISVTRPDPLPAPTELSFAAPAVEVALDGQAWLMLLHLLGTAVVAAWILWDLHALRGLLRRAAEVRDGDLHRRFIELCGRLGLRRRPRLLLSAELPGPAAFGVLRPAVLLPEAVTRLAPDEIETILAHELAHHRRRDLWVNWVQVALAVVWWFNPVLWVLNRLIRKVREDCCDDLLLTHNLTTGPAYCDTLLNAASRLGGRPAVGVTLGFADRLHPLGRRFERIMDRTLWRAPRLSLAGIVLVAVLGGIVLPGLRSSAGDEPAPAPSQDQQKAEPAAAKPEKAAAKPDAADSLVIAGRVVDPEGKPFAGAQLYVTVKSAIHLPPKLKDPNTKTHEQKTVNGKTEVYVVHRRLVALMKKYSLDPAKPITQETFEDPKLRADLQKVMQDLYEEHPFQFPTVRATSGPDGRFRFPLARSWLKQAPHEEVEVLAFADGFGPGWAWAVKDERLADLTVRLVKDVPINGRILDLEGRPVAGATVKLGSIMAGPDGTAKMWTELVEAFMLENTNRFNDLLGQMFKRQMLYTNLTRIPKAVTTDKDGRFRVGGIGADRVVFNVTVTGPQVGHDQFSVMTRAETGIKPPRGGPPLRPEYRTYPATFEHVMSPGRVIAGTVRDGATGKPVEGVQVAAWGPVYVESFSDRDGKYKLVGLSKGKDFSLTFWPYNPRGKLQPYLNTTLRVGDKPGLGPLTVDVNLVRGVLLRGRLTDKVTAKPVGGAEVWYATFKDNPQVAVFAFPGNPNFAGRPEFFDVPQLQQTHTRSGPDGAYEIVVLPGRALLGVRVADGPYVAADLPEARNKPDYWSQTVPSIAGSAEEFQAVKLVDVPEKAAEAKCDLTLDPGRSLTGRILDPDGKPLARVTVTGLNVQEFQSAQPLKGPEFTVTGLSPGRTRLLGFYLPERQLGALVRVRGEDDGPLTVKLQQCGALTGRLVDADGAPRPNVSLWGLLADRGGDKMEGHGRDLSGSTDKDGKFRVEGVVPGVKYDLMTMEGMANINGKLLARGVKLEPGEQKDLGDVPAKAGP